MESRAITEDRTRVNAPSPRYTSGNRQAGRGFDLTISCGALLPRDRHESSRILTKTPLVNRLGPRESPRDTSSKRILLEFMSVLAVKSYPLRDSETPPLLSLSLSSPEHTSFDIQPFRKYIRFLGSAIFPSPFSRAFYVSSF